MALIHKIRALRQLALSILVLVVHQVSICQSLEDAIKKSSNEPVLRIYMISGSILPQNRRFLTNVDENGNTFKAVKAISLDYGWQMRGGNEWQQACKFPRMGFGAQYLHVMRRDELGHPFSVYGFYDGIYFRSKNFEFTNRFTAGLAYTAKKFDPNQTLPNDIFSTHLNAMVELGVGFAARLNDHMYIEPGVRIIHFSNGNLREPQKGLNIVSYNIGLRAILDKQPSSPIIIPMSECKHRHELVTYYGMSTRQLEFTKNINNKPFETYGIDYLMANLHLGYNYEITNRIKVGGGLDLIYDGTNGQRELAVSGIPDKKAIPFHEKLRASAFIGAESTIDRLSILATLGYIFAGTRFEGTSPAFEQRMGFKFHFYKNFFAGVNLRAYRFKAAEALEFNIGVRSYLMK